MYLSGWYREAYTEVYLSGWYREAYTRVYREAGRLLRTEKGGLSGALLLPVSEQKRTKRTKKPATESTLAQGRASSEAGPSAVPALLQGPEPPFNLFYLCFGPIPGRVSLAAPESREGYLLAALLSLAEAGSRIRRAKP